MSTQYKTSAEVPTEVLAKRLDDLSEVISQPGEGRDRELTMRIPAEVDRDADLVLSEASRRLLQLRDERDAATDQVVYWRERALVAEEESAALAVLCEDAAVVLERTANDTLDGRNMARRLRGATDTSLARRDLLKQAEAERDALAMDCELKRGRIYDLEQREQALAAHVEKGSRIVHEWALGSFGDVAAAQQLGEWLHTAPTTSLARLKAQWQAEALVEFGYRYGPESEVRAASQSVATELRRQAEEKPQ